VFLNARGAAALTALPIAAQLLQARWLAGGEPVVSEARVALAAALYALRLGAPMQRRADDASSSEEEDGDSSGSGSDDSAQAASSLEARAAEAWRRLCAGASSALGALPAPEASALALRLAQQTRAYAARAPRWRDRQEAAASAAALMEALSALCVSEGGAQQAALDALLAPAGAWPAWVAFPRDVTAVADAAACEPRPADWARRMAQLSSALALAMPSGALFAGGADAASPPRRVWLAAELLCAGETRAVYTALQGGEAAQQRRLALALLHSLLTMATASDHTASAAAAAALAALRATLRLLARSDAWDGATALTFFAAALTGPAAADGTAAGAALAEAAAPPLLAVLRSPKGGAAGAAAAEQHTLARTRAACAALRVRGAPPGAASVALRCAAACFPGAGDEKEEDAPAPAFTPLGARAGVTDAEVDALCELWECVAAADATAAAAAAAARRFGGADAADADAPLSSADEGVAAVALPLLRCAWHRLSRTDWALLAGRMRRWLTAGATMPPLLAVPPAAETFEAAALAGLPAAACALLAAADALPVAVAEPAPGAAAAAAGRAASGDVVPFSAAGAPALAAARAMAEAGWPVERGALLQAALGALFSAGALCLCDAAGAQHALRAESSAAPFWRALGALCEKAPPGAVRAAADAADARGGGGAIACLYALLRLGSDDAAGQEDDVDAAEQARAGAAPLACAQRAAYALLCSPALRTAGVLGLDAAVTDVEEVLSLADKAAAEQAERADSGDAEPGAPASSTILAAAEEACLREPLAALLAAPGPPRSAATLRAWALLLSALLAAPRGGSAAKRISGYVRDAGRLPQLLSACADALPLPPPKALRPAGGGGAAAAAAAAALVPAGVAAAWRAAAEPAAALAAAASLPPACLAGALFGACLRGLPAESRAWFGELRDARRASALEACVAAWVSPALVAAELDAAAAAPPSVSGLTVRAARGSREVTAAYSVDDALLEVTVRLPGAYPLRAPEAECARRVGVSEARLRKWLLAMAAALRGGGGGVAGALALWGASVEREFAGVEPCPICYMTLHAGSHALPRLACRQCRNRFHAACLYAWFTSSNKSACPICQTPWGTTVS
jgi:hypothetical protein